MSSLYTCKSTQSVLNIKDWYPFFFLHKKKCKNLFFPRHVFFQGIFVNMAECFTGCSPGLLLSQTVKHVIITTSRTSIIYSVSTERIRCQLGTWALSSLKDNDMESPPVWMCARRNAGVAIVVCAQKRTLAPYVSACVWERLRPPYFNCKVIESQEFGKREVIMGWEIINYISISKDTVAHLQRT